MKKILQVFRDQEDISNKKWGAYQETDFSGSVSFS